MKNIVILVSGRGSNMEAIVAACASEGWHARIAAVITNRSNAAGLVFAQQKGIATTVVDDRAYASRDGFDTALGDAIEPHSPHIVVLAGFMRILGAAFVQRFDARLVNIHPSLLPMFPGLHTHQRAIDAGCKLAGASVHRVTADLDHGPILIQAAVPVLANDDAAALAARVLKAEHVIYPRAVRWLVNDALLFDGMAVRHRRGAAQWLMLPEA